MRRFSRTVSRSHSPGASVRKPIRLRSADPVARVSCTPSIATVPLVGAISPASIRSVVVLPAPFGPSSATISPRPTSNVTSLTTVRKPNRRVSPVAAITVAGRRRAGGAGRAVGGQMTPPLCPPASSGLELVQARRDQDAAVLAEKQAVRRDDAGGAELDGARLVAVAIVDVGVGQDERDPEVARAIHRRRADGRRHQRQLAFARLPLRPLRRQVRRRTGRSRVPARAVRRPAGRAASYFRKTGSPV